MKALEKALETSRLWKKMNVDKYFRRHDESIYDQCQM
jgi:hypothetical protein